MVYVLDVVKDGVYVDEDEAEKEDSERDSLEVV